MADPGFMGPGFINFGGPFYFPQSLSVATIKEEHFIFFFIY